MIWIVLFVFVVSAAFMAGYAIGFRDGGVDEARIIGEVFADQVEEELLTERR